MPESQHKSHTRPDTVIDGSRSSSAEPERVLDDNNERLFAAFVACRTTLEDLSDRAAALGEKVSCSLIASHLTGQGSVSDVKHNVVANAINARLGELSLPPAAPYRGGIHRSPDTRLPGHDC